MPDETGRIPLVVPGSAAPPPSGNVLTRAADPTQVIPRLRPDTQLPRVLDPDRAATIAGNDATTATPDGVVPDMRRNPAIAPLTDPGETDEADADDAPSGHPQSDFAYGNYALTKYPDADATDPGHTDPGHTDLADDSGHRRHGWVWVGLAVFWLLALGAGLITLASLGAPHFLCTGSAAKGLACEHTGTVLAAVLTVVLIVAVGWVSVLVIELRAQGRTAWRWLGIGAVALVVVASCGYLLIRTIGG